MQVTTTGVDVTGSTDGVFNLDTTDQRGSFIRFKENGTTKVWAGCSEGIGTGGDQDDFESEQLVDLDSELVLLTVLRLMMKVKLNLDH